MSSRHSSGKLLHIDDYIPIVGKAVISRIKDKAARLRSRHIVHVNSTQYGGGVAEMLLSLTLLMNSLGIKTGWRAIRGIPDFFNITKKMHNALQGASIDLTDLKKEIYEQVVFENSVRIHLDEHDYVVVHDPQPLPIIQHYNRKGKWIWRCHLDLSNPNTGLWNYLSSFIEKYDAAIFTMKSYSQSLSIPQHFFMPAIDPFSLKNIELSESAMNERLAHYGIPQDLPLVTQISRFDKWKDPSGVIQAAKMAMKDVDFRLVLLGNAASDDPEGAKVYEELLKHRNQHILILPHGDDTALVNALQKKSHIVMQKSIREGFGLTVTEAMWKKTVVIGGNAGGIPQQIDHGVTGFLADSTENAAHHIVDIIRNPSRSNEVGEKAKNKVLHHFLMTRLLEQYLDLFNSIQ